MILVYYFSLLLLQLVAGWGGYSMFEVPVINIQPYSMCNSDDPLNTSLMYGSELNLLLATMDGTGWIEGVDYQWHCYGIMEGIILHMTPTSTSLIMGFHVINSTRLIQGQILGQVRAPILLLISIELGISRSAHFNVWNERAIPMGATKVAFLFDILPFRLDLGPLSSFCPRDHSAQH